MKKLKKISLFDNCKGLNILTHNENQKITGGQGTYGTTGNDCYFNVLTYINNTYGCSEGKGVNQYSTEYADYLGGGIYGAMEATLGPSNLNEVTDFFYNNFAPYGSGRGVSKQDVADYFADLESGSNDNANSPIFAAIFDMEVEGVGSGAGTETTRHAAIIIDYVEGSDGDSYFICQDPDTGRERQVSPEDMHRILGTTGCK